MDFASCTRPGCFRPPPCPCMKIALAESRLSQGKLGSSRRVEKRRRKRGRRTQAGRYSRRKFIGFRKLVRNAHRINAAITLLRQSYRASLKWFKRGSLINKPNASKTPEALMCSEAGAQFPPNNETMLRSGSSGCRGASAFSSAKHRMPTFVRHVLWASFPPVGLAIPGGGRD